MSNSDFPDFDQAYQTVLVKDLEDKFEQLAAAANFNIYHSDIWRGTARKFAESIVRECANIAAATPCPYENEEIRKLHGHSWDMACVESRREILKHFGVDK